MGAKHENLHPDVFYAMIVSLFFLVLDPTGSHLAAECVSGDCIDGFGTFEYPGGNRYEGEFRDNKRYGTGTFYWENGEKYTGGFKDNVMDGEGTYTWPAGSSFEGTWKNDEKHGAGILHRPDGTTEKQYWRYGRLSKDRRKRP